MIPIPLSVLMQAIVFYGMSKTSANDSLESECKTKVMTESQPLRRSCRRAVRQEADRVEEVHKDVQTLEKIEVDTVSTSL